MKLLIKIFIYKYLSFFVWSHENDLKRSEEEKQNIYNIVEFVCRHNVEKLNQSGVRIRLLGDKPSFVNEKLADLLEATVDKLKNNTAIDVSLYFGYGSRSELIKAARECATDVKEGKINVEDINEDMFRSKFYAPDVPDPDIVIRTSGEVRISNFLLWQMAFSELFFVDKYWPDFNEEDLKDVLRQFENRERRYGV